MEDELLVLYINKEDGSLHQVLLNSLELKRVANEIAQIFAAKKMDVRVSDTKLRLYEEGNINGNKTNSRKV
jgi:hypothetical protein